jgi:hypothetical protein
MGAGFWHHRTGGQDIAGAPRSGGRKPPRPGKDGIDWRAVQRADRACCCPARPVVIAIMPPSADRPHQTELLLCGHHYHVSQQALRAAGATIADIKGTPIAGGSRPPARVGVS